MRLPIAQGRIVWDARFQRKAIPVLPKPRLFKRAGVWFCALPGEAGAVGPTMRDAWEWWVMLKKAS